MSVEAGASTNFQGHSMFSLMFNEEVRVKKTSVDKFNFMDSLNFFGSNLGLWPGLGVYQILEGMVGIFLVSQFLKKIRELVGKMLSGLKLKGKQKENQVPSSKSDKIGLIEQFSQ